MLHLLSSVVNPALGLRVAIEKWPQISMDLREPPRKRKLQTEKLGTKLFKQTPC